MYPDQGGRTGVGVDGPDCTGTERTSEPLTLGTHREGSRRPGGPEKTSHLCPRHTPVVGDRESFLFRRRTRGETKRNGEVTRRDPGEMDVGSPLGDGSRRELTLQGTDR